MAAYDGPIVDAHHHFWQPELGRQPWLLPEAHIPFRYGDYESIKHSYLPPNLLADSRGFNVVGTVTMETEWDEDDPIGEIEHMEGVRECFGLPNAAVAHAVLNDPGVESVLEQLAAHSIVPAIRHKPGQAPTSAEASTRPSLMRDVQWQKGFALLTKYGLDFELQTAWWHLHEAYELATRYPETAITINHAALPSDRSPEALAGWRACLAEIATLDQVAIKISGIGLRGIPWTASNNRVIVETITELFGPGRIMFASNFPVDRLTGSYQEIYGGFVELTRGWSNAEQTAAFIGNAIRVYRLDPQLLQRSSAPGSRAFRHQR